VRLRISRQLPGEERELLAEIDSNGFTPAFYDEAVLDKATYFIAVVSTTGGSYPPPYTRFAMFR
jgi:hypothetical protein